MLVRSDVLGQMRLVVWVRMEVLAGLVATATSTVATGIGNMIGNKGAVAVALWIWSTPLIFINSHLAAHQNETKRRNLDYSNIVAGLNISSYPSVDANLANFEHIIWM